MPRKRPPNTKWLGYTTLYPSEYASWAAMVRRCTDPKDESYPDYGGRGIQVYEPWIDDFMLFFIHLGIKPDPSLEIDRIDNDGSYIPGNVRWATQQQQSRNKRNNVVIAYNGKSQSVAQWATDFQIPQTKLRSRIKRLGAIAALQQAEKEYLYLEGIAPSQGPIGSRDPELERQLSEDFYDRDDDD